MKSYILLLISVASLINSSPTVFSVHDDLLAFPQYQIIFSETFISSQDAESRLASTAQTDPPTPNTEEDTGAELSQRNHQHDNPNSDPHEPFKYDLDGSSTETYESMILHGKPYLCAIPTVKASPQNASTFTASKADEANELARASERGWELLKDMDCMYFISGWWSYSFCYNRHVKQFHQLPPGKGAPPFPPVEDPATPSFVLGQFGGKDGGRRAELGGGEMEVGGGGAEMTEMQAKGEVRYLVQKLGGGTTCDLTGRERRVEIQFHCHPQSADRIGWIKEVTTCSYLMVIYTPRLCHDAAFLPPRENTAHPITCREVVSDDDVPAWQSRIAADAARKLVNGGSDGGRPTVGGIEVGGMKHVGHEGHRLETPQAPQPAPASTSSSLSEEGTTDVVAQSSSGGKVQRLSDEELRTMDLDPETVDLLRRELQELAGERGWKLEVFEAGDGGRELRGVVEGDGEGEGEEVVEIMIVGEEEEGGVGGSEEGYRDEL